MTEMLDAIIVGLGAMGSATTWQLARRGAKVLGIDQYSPPHRLGSSHGDTRITRKAIGEGERYIPLALRSYELFREVEALTGHSLLTVTGGLIISSRSPHAMSHVPGFFDNTLAAARRHHIVHEVLDATQMRARFPVFKVRDDEFGYFEPDAGFLRPEACVAAQLELAAREGARIHRDEKVEGFTQSNGHVVVATSRGEYAAKQLILAAGPWIAELIDEEYGRLFRVTRQAQFWFDVPSDIARFEPGRFPIFIWELQGAAQPIYGFPAIDGPRGGLKIASEQDVATTTPDTVDREVSAEEAREMHATRVAPYFPDVGAHCVKSACCLYTATPDAHFVIDRHPQHPQVIVASPCSGHGFKHSAAIGEALAQIVMDGKSTIDMSPFAFSRLGAHGASR
jgi:sarcosine oxidase